MQVRSIRETFTLLFLLAAVSSPAVSQKRHTPSAFAVAQEPQKWVNNHECDPIAYSETINLPAGTITPPVQGLGPYTCTSGMLDNCVQQLQQALRDWATNTDGNHNALDQSWHIVIAHGTLLNFSTGLVVPIKTNSPTKCAVIESDQPLTEQTACSHDITDRAIRNPGCSNDIAKMYTFRMDTVSPGADAILFQPGSNHVVVRDAEFTLLPGINQSQASPAPTDPVFVKLWGNDIGLDRVYIHGFDPGDREWAFGSPNGDDVGEGVSFRCIYCWLTNSYLEKIHWWNSESHGIGGGFSTGPYKIVGNWIEGASEALIFGGGPVDINATVNPPTACTPPQCGPEADVEIRRNRFTHDLNWRLLTGAAGNSPSPPYGCHQQPPAPTCTYKWSLKNNFELKMGQRILVDGNIFENMWPDGQTGEDILTYIRVCSGGQQCGVFDRLGPATVISDLIFTGDIIRNAVDAFNGSGGGRSGLTPGDGGGVSQGGNRSIHRNLLIYNVGDNNQFGGISSRAFQIGAAGNSYSCAMSRSNNVAKAVCQPTPGCVGAAPNCNSKAGITSLTKNASGVVTMVFSNRQDPLLGATVTVNGAPTGTNGTNFNGTFPIASANTGATTPPQLTYQLAAGTDTSCTNSSTCNAVGAVFPTLGTSIHDISAGDFVYVSSCSGGVAPLNYQVGAANPGVPALMPTTPNSLTVYYSNTGPNDSGGTTCNVSNKGGWSQNLAWDHVTLAVPGGIQMQDNYGPSTLPINNQFTNSIYVFNGPSNANGFYCTSALGSPKEGTVAESCYDASSLVFNHNVLQGRTGTNYTTYPPPGGICRLQGDPGNCFPATATCSGGTVSVDANGDPTCVGFLGFMNGIAFPTSFCTSPASSPGGCLLMSPPYGTFDYHQLSLTGTSANNPYKGGGTDDASDGKDMGADINNAIDNALTRTKYVCTAICGTPGPYPD